MEKETKVEETKQAEKPVETKVETKEKKTKQAEKPVDSSTYDKYTSLKFLKLSEAKLTDEQLKALEELEKEVASCTGKKPIRTVRAAIKNEQVLLVEGIPVPKHIEKIINGCHAPEYYFGE